MNSQNGWPASPDKSAIGIVRVVVPGTDIDFPQGVKSGDVATVLMYVAEQFHKTVEALVDGWCWGYNYRKIEGSSSLSNHASGTAIDLNAPNHPMGKGGTFSASQVTAIRRILTYCEYVVRWGGDFSRKDEMHFEIVGSAAAVARVAAKIRGASVPAPAPAPLPVHQLGSRLLKRGMTGTDVAEAQRLLKTRGYAIEADGVFGPATENAVKQFQGNRWLDDDGVIGPDTLGTLQSNLGYRMLKRGLKGLDVAELQRLLMRKNYNLSPYFADGDFGGVTERRVRDFQLAAFGSRGVDGIAGPNTIRALRG